MWGQGSRRVRREPINKTEYGRLGQWCKKFAFWEKGREQSKVGTRPSLGWNFGCSLFLPAWVYLAWYPSMQR